MPGQQQPSITGYIYDGDGVRVAKGTIPSTTVAGFFALGCDPSGWSGFQFTADYVLGPGGEQLTQFDGQGKWQRTNVYAAGKLVGTYDLVSNPQYTAGGTAPAQIPWLHFHFTDALGTRRMQVSGMLANLGQPEMDFQSLPFGDQLATLADPYAAQTSASTPIGATPLFFTGKERDAESGLDYMDARYYGSSMGRFMSPDPVFASKYKVADPQQWNMYAYARNNPLLVTDPSGMDFNLTCSGSSLTCQGGVQGQYQFDNNGNLNFEATDIDMNKQGDPSAGYSDQWGNDYTGTFDQNNGVSFTSADGTTSGHSQFIDGSDPTQLKGIGAFSGISGNFFDACGKNSSCQGRATLTGSASAFDNMKSILSKQSRLSTLLDGFSLAHPFISDQWKGGDGGYAHIIKAPHYQWDMHFEGSAPGAGVTGFALHMLGTIKEMVDGTALGERSKLVPEQ